MGKDKQLKGHRVELDKLEKHHTKILKKRVMCHPALLKRLRWGVDMIK